MGEIISKFIAVVAKSCWTLATPWTVPARLLCSWEFPSKNTGVGCHFLFQEIFPTCQGLNFHLLHWQVYSVPLSHLGSPGSSVHRILQDRILELVAIPFSMGSSQPRVSCMASLVAQRLRRLPEMWETQVRSLGQKDPLEKEMATHSSILAWRMPWMEEPGRLQSMESQRVGHDWATFTLLYTAPNIL